MRIDGHTRLAAVVASPIKHSISPFIHNRAFELTGVNGVYIAWDIVAEDLAETVQNIRRYDMFGINLSMPYKEVVLPHLDELTPVARMVGAVNTVINSNGTLIGHNTDGKGFFKSLPEFKIKGANIVVLGAGGAAKAIISQAILDGVSSVAIFVRKKSIEKTRSIYPNLGDQISVYDLEDIQSLVRLLTGADLLVNATSVGMDGLSNPISEEVVFPSQLLVADVIYQPFETPFLKQAKKQGLKTVNGLGMLLYQAAEAFEIWTNHAMPTEVIWEELEQRYR
ncbi:Shikimate/quinate 5-dehydrogenase I beta [Streptococcus sp. DD10]|uniref:shikimate dehydrogenase n=1 Tax=Streptococcus sp. DD10 TaxID=1777878 RepID=UPI00079CBA6D|nr:shikimate dehydrogenase [Streptococcus sp. DD10]KXT77321.1 Shikimate/quinate 5-dehydrogenase I beta [Streptococcus sp. DD10]